MNHTKKPIISEEEQNKPMNSYNKFCDDMLVKHISQQNGNYGITTVGFTDGSYNEPSYKRNSDGSLDLEHPHRTKNACVIDMCNPECSQLMFGNVECFNQYYIEVTYIDKPTIVDSNILELRNNIEQKLRKHFSSVTYICDVDLGDDTETEEFTEECQCMANNHTFGFFVKP